MYVPVEWGMKVHQQIVGHYNLGDKDYIDHLFVGQKKWKQKEQGGNCINENFTKSQVIKWMLLANIDFFFFF